MKKELTKEEFMALLNEPEGELDEKDKQIRKEMGDLTGLTAKEMFERFINTTPIKESVDELEQSYKLWGMKWERENQEE